MSDSLHDYLKQNKPPVPPAPSDEWARILARTQLDRKSRQHRVWVYASALTLSAAGLLAFLNRTEPSREVETWLEVEDVVYREKADTPEGGAYQDWLWLADHVGTDPVE